MTLPDLVRIARATMTPEWLATVQLRRGTGTGKEGDACLIQVERRVLRDVALAYGAADLAAQYDPSTDACPPCTSPICGRLGIAIQDARDDWRAECVSVLPLLVGSAGSPSLESRRAHRLLDWCIREVMPAYITILAAHVEPHDAMLAASLRAHGVTTGAIAPIVDSASRSAAVKPIIDLDLDLDLAHGLALVLSIDLDLDLDHALGHALDHALDLDHALAHDLDLDLARDHARVIKLGRTLALVIDLDLPIPSPVALLLELCAMVDE